MACNGLTLRGPDGKEFCFPIVYEMLLFKIPDPGPEEVELKQPWEELIRVSVINEMILRSGLSERVRAPLRQAIRSVSADLQKQLPQGYSAQLRDQQQEQCSEKIKSGQFQSD